MMNVFLVKQPFEHVIIDNFYTEEELVLVWRELEFLTPKLLAPNETGSAKEGGVEIKHNSAAFLDSVYADRRFSDILHLNRKLFCEGITANAAALHPSYRSLRHSTRDSTLVNYYEDGGAYPPHFDYSMFTAITFLYKEPKGFVGGEFLFSDYQHEVEIKNNRTVIFYGGVTHEVAPVRMIASGPCLGRYSIAQMVNFCV